MYLGVVCRAAPSSALIKTMRAKFIITEMLELMLSLHAFKLKRFISTYKIQHTSLKSIRLRFIEPLSCKKIKSIKFFSYLASQTNSFSNLLLQPLVADQQK